MKTPEFGVQNMKDYSDLKMITFPAIDHLFANRMIVTMKVTTRWIIKSGSYEGTIKTMNGPRLSIDGIFIDLSRCSLTHKDLVELALNGSLPPDSAWTVKNKEKK